MDGRTRGWRSNGAHARPAARARCRGSRRAPVPSADDGRADGVRRRPAPGLLDLLDGRALRRARRRGALIRARLGHPASAWRAGSSVTKHTEGFSCQANPCNDPH